jgi:uncharacterized protein
MKLSHYIKICPYEEKSGYSLVYSTRRASITLVSEAVLKSIGNDSLSPSDSETLESLGFLIDDVNKEKQAMRQYFETINSNNTFFNVIAVMNLNCNLACSYCYEGTLKGNHFMSQETADQLIEFVKASVTPIKTRINIDFYGGEPLLSFELIKYISQELQGFAKERGIEYSFCLITNGTLLTRQKAEELASLGLRGVKITLDGTKETHDKFRPFKSGAGSFDTIIRNIKETCDIIKIGIGGNYGKDNFRGFPQLLDYLLGEGLTPDNIPQVKFDPIMKPDSKYSPADFKDIGCDSINEPWLIQASFLLREGILKRGYNTPKIVPTPCMVDVKDEYVVNYDGSMYKCPGLIGREEFKVGDLVKGIKDFSEAYNVGLWKNEECLDCEYLPLCFGGCRYMKLMRDGNIDGVDCKRAYYDATLETFIKQDIKYRIKPQ